MKTIATIFLLVASFASNAQNETSLLNNYNYRTKGYLGIDIFGGLSSGNSRNSSNTFKTKYNSFNVGLNPNLFGQYVSDKEQISYSLELKSQLNFQRNKLDANKIIDNSHYINLPINVNYKRFYNQDYFVGLSLSSSSVLSNTKYIDSSTSMIGSSFFNTLIPMASIGKGRINNINPMEKVLWILRDLKNENLLNSDLSENEITDFANAIVEIDNTRMFDFRRKNKFALNLLLDKIKNHVSEKNLTTALNVIQDNYYFALNNFRYRGQEISASLGIYNDYRKNHLKEIQEYKSSTNYFTPQLIIDYKRYKPLSLKRQIEYGASLGVAKSFLNDKNTTIINDTNVFTSQNSSKHNEFHSSAFVGYGYYFSTRSNLQSGLALNYRISSPNFNSFSVTPYFHFNYMINYRLRLTGIVRANINEEIYINNKSHFANFTTMVNLYYNLR